MSKGRGTAEEAQSPGVCHALTFPGNEQLVSPLAMWLLKGLTQLLCTPRMMRTN